MEKIRDPLVLAYEAIQMAIQTVHGKDFLIFDDLPDATEFKKQLPAANISNISSTIEKALMREFEPHKIKNNNNGTYTVATETLRFDYLMQVSFFAHKKGIVQKLSTEFIMYMEEKNELLLPDDFWNETMQIFLQSSPTAPHGEPDLYQCDQTWLCRGKLLTSEIVNSIDVTNLRFKIKNI